MAKKVTIKFDYKAFNAYRKSPEVRAEIERRTRAVSDAAGGEDDYPVEILENKNRVWGKVETGTWEAQEEEAANKTLTRALDAGRY